jgi:hypothetical protein
MTMAGMPGGPAGGRMISCGGGSAALASGTAKLTMDKAKMAVRKTKKAMAFFCECLYISLTSKQCNINWFSLIGDYGILAIVLEYI